MNKKNIIMFGASKMGEAAYKLLKDSYNVICFCDNDKNKWGKILCGLSIISPEDLKNQNLNEVKIIITSMYYKQILEQLNSIKINDVEIFNFYIKSVKQLEYDKENIHYLKNYIDKNNVNGNNNHNLHIMIDSVYCMRYIEFINEHFDPNEHKFVVIADDVVKYVKDIKKYENIEIMYNGKYTDLKLYSYVRLAKKVFIHYLTDYVCRFICEYDIDKYLEINWILWGADLYGYIETELYDKKTKEFICDKNSNLSYLNNYNRLGNDKYREEAIKRINYILPDGIWEDYNIAKKFFYTNAKMKKFLYPNPVNYESIELTIKENSNEFIRKIKKQYKYIIQVGNSGDPSNNHIDVFEKLNKFVDNSFCILCPLSYGVSKYIDELIIVGKKLFGERFMPLTEFMDKAEYYNILSEVDVAIMNHNRQQAIGNIFLLLYLKKKVYIKNQITTYKSLLDYGINVYDFDRLDNMNFEELIYMDDDLKSKNRDIIKQLYNNNNLINWMNDIF